MAITLRTKLEKIKADRKHMAIQTNKVLKLKDTLSENRVYIKNVNGEFIEIKTFQFDVDAKEKIIIDELNRLEKINKMMEYEYNQLIKELERKYK